MINPGKYGEKNYNTAVIHGGPGAPGSVAAIAVELSKDYGVLEPIQTKTTISGLILELHEIFDTHSILPVTLIGHSWGAWLSYIFASSYPSMVKKLILVGAGPFKDEYVPEIEKNRLSRLSETEKSEYIDLSTQLGSGEVIVNRDESDRMLKRFSQLVIKSDTYSFLENESEEYNTIPTDALMYNSIWNEASEMRKTGQLISLGKKIQCHVTAIHGDYDPHPAEGVKAVLSKTIRTFEFYLLEKCGHYPWKEKYARNDFYNILRNTMSV
jgi:pimeloyl-ACP methyl ester carboxylesterase